MRRLWALAAMAAVAGGAQEGQTFDTCQIKMQMNGEETTISWSTRDSRESVVALANRISEPLIGNDTVGSGCTGGACARDLVREAIVRQHLGCLRLHDLHAKRCGRDRAAARAHALAPECRNVADAGTARRRVALLFFGLNRSMRHTIESIRARLLAPLARACVEVDILVHTYNATHGRSASDEEARASIGGWEEMLELLRRVACAVFSTCLSSGCWGGGGHISACRGRRGRHISTCRERRVLM